MRVLHGLAISLAAVVLAACSSTSPTTADYDPSTDFSQYKTYGFIEHPATDEAEYQSLATSHLKKAVAKQMALRGLTESANPDLLVNFSIDTQEKVQSRSVPSSRYGVGYDPFYDVYYDGWATTHETRITQYTEGKLNIDLIDTAKRELVWRGETKGKLTKKVMENFSQALTEATAEIFMEFPVAPAAVQQ